MTRTKYVMGLEWTEDDISELIKLLQEDDRLTVDQIGKRLNRTSAAVNSAITRYSLVGMTNNCGTSTRRGKLRKCLTCSREFWSQGSHNRMCVRCRANC